MSRWVAVVVVAVVLLIVGCSSSGDGDGAAESTPKPVSTTTSTQPPGAFVDVSDLEGHGIDATRVTPTLDGQPFDLSTRQFDVMSIGGVLIVEFYTNDPALTGLASSTDGGRTWRSVRFPEPRDTWRDSLLYRMGDAVVVTASDVRPNTDKRFIWTTVDGHEWHGGAVTVSSDVSGLTVSGGQIPDGTLVLPVITEDQHDERVLTSSDDGVSWEEGECPVVASSEAFGCMGLRSAGRGLWLALHNVSLDDGHTWQPFEVSPDPEPTGDQRLGAAAALADAGWLGVVSEAVVENGDLVEVPYLARSHDGLVWEPVFTDPCANAPDTLANGFSKPEAFGDGWLVSHDCAREAVSIHSELQLLDSTGANPSMVARMDTGDIDDIDDPHDVGFGTPVAIGDIVVVPEIDLNLPDPLRILQLQPTI